jgi:branched-chain amino acid transport system substrate-binding protein
MLQQAKEVGFSPKFFVGSTSRMAGTFRRLSPAEGVTLYGMWAPTITESARSRALLECLHEMFKEEPATYFAPSRYTNIYFLAEGIKAAGTIEKSALIKALEQVEYASPSVYVLKIAPSNVKNHQGFTAQKILQCRVANST